MIKLYYQINKYNKDGKLVKKTRKRKAKSFVKAFVTSIASDMNDENYYTTPTIGGNTQNVNKYVMMRMSVCGLQSGLVNETYRGDSTWYTSSTDAGIILGTGTTAVTSSDYAIETMVPYGTGSGEMIYYGCWTYNYNVAGSTAGFDIERIFQNSSGGSITINELALYSRPSTYGFCSARDMVSPGVAIANGEYLKVKYTIQAIV